MALKCIHCGKVLPRDDARFCTNCGAPVAPRRSSTQPSSSQAPSTPPPPARTQPERKKTALREQIAQQPPARSTQGEQDAVGAKKAEEAGEGEQRGQPSVAWPAPLTHITIAEPPADEPEEPDDMAQEDFPASAQKPRSNDIPAPALQAKAWKSESPSEDEAAKATAIEDLPTREVVVAPAERTATEKGAVEKPPHTPSPSASSRQSEAAVSAPTPIGVADEDRRDDVAQRETQLLTAQRTPSAPAFPRLPHTPRPSSRQVALPFPAADGRRALWLIVAGLLCILVLGGVVTWIVRSQPFSVPAVTQPQQSFQNKQLGIALLYPNGWTVQVERSKSSVHFSDSSHTASVDITIASVSNSNLAQYLQQQARQRGMTGVKAGAPLSFAGASWQRIQGNVLESGANYIETIFATVHNDHLVVLTQLAHQSIYTAEEKISFSPLRSSLRFV